VNVVVAAEVGLSEGLSPTEGMTGETTGIMSAETIGGTTTDTKGSTTKLKSKDLARLHSNLLRSRRSSTDKTLMPSLRCDLAATK
jgi:hypothetical protein